MSVSNFKSLQRVQNTLVRVVLLHRGKFEHITPAMTGLHWLPVHYRVTYKLATLTYNIKRSGPPSYLHELGLLQDYQPTYSLRSDSHDLLATTRPRSVAPHAFRLSAATTWNSIPVNIRNVCETIVTLKRRVKTFLLNQSHLVTVSARLRIAFDIYIWRVMFYFAYLLAQRQ